MKFELSPEILEKVPAFVVGIVVARGLDNARPAERISALLAGHFAEAASSMAGKAKEDARIAPYREAFAALGINPNRYPCSIEALMSRVQKGGEPPSINAAVDAGNAVSARHFVPIGAHDLGAVSGEISLRPARSGDVFLPFGGGEREDPEPGEPVYASGSVVRTRRWMWRQSETGKIAAETRDIFFPIDGFSGVNEAAVLAARDELARLMKDELGGTVVLGFVDAKAPVFEG
ncbi:MAG TPA: phenylalanine--tRNA ligase beta subunit-related protein [Rectinemataceae bacterium]|nr:phenylalanine--tRNA ligase beta subunit-related protein [Rectinemataceae bacterium]